MKKVLCQTRKIANENDSQVILRKMTKNEGLLINIM